MLICVVGATGRVGTLLVDSAVDAGHQVVAVARRPVPVPGVRLVTVDLARPDHHRLTAAVEGADAVVSALGARTAADVGVATTGTAAVIAAMQQVGAHRLVVVSAGPVATLASPGRPDPPWRDPGDGPLAHLVLMPLLRQILARSYADLATMEDAVRASGLDWTIVRPPRLTDRPGTGCYRVALGHNVRGGLSIPRADLAHLMLAAVGDPRTVATTVGVAATRRRP